MRVRMLGVAVLLAALAACGSAAGEVVEAAPLDQGGPAGGAPRSPAPEPYDGPLFVRATNSGTDWAARSGAAGRALRCDGEIYQGYTDGEIPSYGGGAEPEAALEAFLKTGPGSVPDTGYRLVRREGDRALFTYDVDGRAKVALTAVERTEEVDSFGDPIDRDRDRVDWPWTGEAWAQCDPAEFAPAADAELRIGIWNDQEGNRVPARDVWSRGSNGHCWPGALLLSVRRAGKTYVRDPEGAYDVGVLSTSYEAWSALPPDAVDTGWVRGDRHVWLAADDRAAYVVMPDRVERWPALVTPLSCM